MAATGEPLEPTWRRGLERATALLALLPAALLVWAGPGAPLAGDLQPELAGAGWAALAAVPAGLAVVLRGAWTRAPWVWLYVAFLIAGVLVLELRPPTDTLEASRAGLLGLATLTCLLAGASLGESGRRWLAGGLVAVALLALLPATFAGEAGLAGALGNKTATSEVALPGALAGALLLASPGRWSRAAGGAALLLFALHAGRGPVLAGALALGLTLLAAAVLAPGASARGRARRKGLALALVLSTAAVAAGRLERAPAAAPETTPGQLADAAQPGLPPPSDLRGLEVRALVAAASLRMLADRALLGVGPGQFAAAFPVWRDPAEIELSTLGHNLPGQTTEVEHAHDDWLQGALDTGLVGGLPWIAFLIVVVVRASRALRAEGPALAALGGAALALLVEALARAPLLSNPAAACAAFTVFGALLGPREGPRSRSTPGRILVNATLVLIALSAPRAWALVQHGRELARLPAGEAPATEVLLRALEHCPDSVLARSLYARLAPLEAGARGAAQVDGAPLWQRVLDLRPHRYEAWVALGTTWARAGRLDEAREAYERAARLDPGDPVLRLNLARLEVEAGRPDAALEHAALLERAGRLPAGWIEGAVVEALRRLDPITAQELLAHARPDWGELSAATAWQRAQESEAQAPQLARSLRGAAHLEWAREQIAAGDPATAVRSYRQALQALSWRDREGGEVHFPPALRLELAAALLRVGKAAEAAQEAARAGAGPRELASLPSWVGDELMAAGLIVR